MATEFIVMERTASMPRSCWGTYRRIVVVEVLQGNVPKMISPRARGMVRIIRTWDRCSLTRRRGYATAEAAAKAGSQCAAAVAWRSATALADALTRAARTDVK